MGMIRGRISFGDGGRGMAALGGSRHIHIGEPLTTYQKDGEWYCKTTHKKLKKYSLSEFLKLGEERERSSQKR